MSQPRVLISRPDGQADALIAQLRAAGHRPVWVPALVITPLPLSDADRRRLLDLDLYHAVFFVSANAAQQGLTAMADLWPQWPLGVHWLAVGEATAAVIRAAGLDPVVPTWGFNSEAVLALPCLAEVADKRILICRADTGRDWLAARLRERGAQVDVVPLYRRDANPAFAWPADTASVMVTSVDGWRAMASKVPAQATVIAAGERVAEQVRGDHRGTVITASSAHDADMVAALPSP